MWYWCFHWVLNVKAQSRWDTAFHEILVLKLNAYTSRGSNSGILIFAFILNLSKFLPLRVDPLFRVLCPQGKQAKSHNNSLYRNYFLLWKHSVLQIFTTQSHMRFCCKITHAGFELTITSSKFATWKAHLPPVKHVGCKKLLPDASTCIINAFDHMEFCLAINLKMEPGFTWPSIFATRYVSFATTLNKCTR